MARTQSDDPATPKAKSDAYTGMLALSLIALLGGGALLYLDYSRYPKNEPPKVPPSDSGAPDQKKPNP